jgi:hypothetical protein
VNQLESGTSSSVLTFIARTSRLSPGLTAVLTTKSNRLRSSTATTFAASNARSSSTHSGSSGKNRGLPP